MRLEIFPAEREIVEVELNGVLERAEVIKVDNWLAKIYFESSRRYEWIYLGSPRISIIYRSLIRKKRLDHFINIKKYSTCLSANDDIVAIDVVEANGTLERPLSVKNFHLQKATNSPALVKSPGMHNQHKCSHECVRHEDSCDFKKIASHSVYQRPLIMHWKILRKGNRSNQKKFYQTPCGIDLYSLNDIDKYLAKTDSKLRIDWFDLNKNIKITAGSVQTTGKDVSNRKEQNLFP